MRFITISAAILLGSASAAAQGQHRPNSAQTPAKGETTTTPITTSAQAQKTPLEKGLSGPGMNFVSGGSDTCGTAVAISGPGPFLGDNVGATTDGPAGFCATTGQDVWYDWTSTVTGPVTATTCNAGSNFDTVLHIYDGAGCVGPVLGCNDDAACSFSGLRSTATFAAVNGNVYKIRVAGFSTSTGSYELTFSVPPPPGAGDLCGSPLIAVTGANAFDLTGNTTGPEGQSEAACLAFGTDDITNDEWWTWVADCTGTATVTLCGGTAVDTKVAAYNGSGCPGGPALACNDDTCGLQSQIGFAVTNGSSYTIQLGTFPGAGAGAGTFTISCAGVIPPEDNCATPAIAVTGVNPFDLAGNSTGPEGQAEGICLFFGSMAIENDEWYTWIADCTGTATVQLCGQTTVDSKVAAYNGSGCPGGPALACNDDFCGLQSSITFACTSGNPYTIQLGTFPGASIGAGTFTIQCDAPPPPSGPCDILHDGSTENSLGFNSTAADVLWLHSQGEIGTSTVVKSIATAWGSLPFGGGPPNGTAARVGIWSDPNQDRDPTDAVLIQSVNTFVVGTNTDALQVVNLSPSVLVNGRYFIGASCQGATFQAPLDQSSGPGGNFVWVCGNPTGVLNYNSIGTAPFPPQQEDNFAPGRWLLQGDCKDIEITEMCGVTLPTDCPCGNGGLPGNGCGNSVNPSGAHLSGSGNSIISADTVSIVATGVRGGNPELALFFSGGETAQNPVNDGLLCAGTPICRLWIWKVFGTGGQSITLTGPDGTTIPPNVGIAQRSADLGRPIQNSETRVYTIWYRDPANFACASPALSNYTNGLRILWSQ
jgi:hypothetical protein